jgi:hypothetical protein
VVNRRPAAVDDAEEPGEAEDRHGITIADGAEEILKPS